ncbi:DUF4097 family beta strand repeat-containing protein [Heyndrickxia vini]|uniref:DUF4097 family beta strand repeat protein n=1 Tax=Heyndrickxia vini TaxID=1476025 RepID=A0ABX7E0J8_9BACI|nr:DUF4097 family beta strand repeat-containing protein [Heyndrickxia vini]QQZ08865.1 DUF4097 family beta strand repeat protein [Heyndrickxia vini]
MKKMVGGALILLIIGIIGTVATLYFSKGSILNLTEWEKKKSVSSNGIDKLDINSGPVDVIVEKTSDKDIQIRLAGKESIRKKGEYKLEVNEEQHTLNVKVKQKVHFGITFYSSVKLYVSVPDKMYQTLDVKTSSGELAVKDFQAENASFQASSGDVLVEDGRVKNDLSLEATSGSIKAMNNQANNILLKTSSGDILTEDGKASENLSIDVTSGEISVTNNEATKVVLKSTSGDIEVNQLAAKESEFTATSGEIYVDDISGTIIGSATSGDIEIVPNAHIGNTSLETTSGSITVNTKQKSIPFAIDYEGGSGEGDVSVTGANYTDKSEHRIIGKIESGTIKLKVRTGSGDFDLQ